MDWEIAFTQFLQSGEKGFLDYLMYGFTQLGGELFFMLAAVVLYWCIDKRFGYKFINVFMLGQLCVGAVKTLIKRPRPYTKEGVKSIFAPTGGWSFPSGHSHNLSNVTTQLCFYTYKKEEAGHHRRFLTVLIAGILLTLTVMFSRVYLGQHYVTDVLAGSIIGIMVAMVGSVCFELLKNREENLVFAVAPLCVLVTIFLLTLNIDFKSDEIIKVAGVYSAVSIGYFLEKRYVRYDVKSGAVWKQLLKLLLGLAMLLILKEGLKFLFGLFLVEGTIGDFILNQFFRYFVVGIFTTLLAPLLFKRIRL